VEFNQLMHKPFALGRIQNNLAPAPRIEPDRPLHRRMEEAWQVLTGKAFGIICYEDIPPPLEEEGNEDDDAPEWPVEDP